MRLRNHIQFTFIFIFFVLLFLKSFLYTLIWYQIQISRFHYIRIQINFPIVVRFQVFVSNTDNYIVLSNCFYLIIVIHLHIVIRFQVTYADQQKKKNWSIIIRCILVSTSTFWGWEVSYHFAVDAICAFYKCTMNTIPGIKWSQTAWHAFKISQST